MPLWETSSIVVGALVLVGALAAGVWFVRIGMRTRWVLALGLMFFGVWYAGDRVLPLGRSVYLKSGDVATIHLPNGVDLGPNRWYSMGVLLDEGSGFSRERIEGTQDLELLRLSGFPGFVECTDDEGVRGKLLLTWSVMGTSDQLEGIVTRLPDDGSLPGLLH